MPKLDFQAKIWPTMGKRLLTTAIKDVNNFAHIFKNEHLLVYIACLDLKLTICFVFSKAKILFLVTIGCYLDVSFV